MESDNENRKLKSKLSSSTEYRRKQKVNDPEKYEKYLTYQKEQGKKNRSELKKRLNKSKPSKKDVETQEKIKLQNRIRQEKFRRKKQNKTKQKSTSTSSSALIKVSFKHVTCQEKVNQNEKGRTDK
ncbi:hypothetical protein LOTGIDRAFT_155078 [Lottia gigantea]|uniref:Uncharacterized protein n=1 Tax=Lottia gigantea TaxID=225164 RepID=V4B9I3_LOTGI|nr:hypothetical protein LOTGIDRAFT_155078 [Lottia gigantea]ESO85589.1 hypothetical protein LOTGIDRAFT_155078 [Lottia gigantea]